ncbi:hypothetical protein [Anaeromyxobacter oryzisoli]|uniref:hypothetical protein n=1 Tax=Anaeromyxobacter oryzisoli TaxID=2925408 RepID=UPI001F5A7509|nr:hypothetical protein [Anaeromyxobacter sp. SG63]
MLSRILAFRPASVVERLAPRSDACPISLRDLLGPAAALRLVLPVVGGPPAGGGRAAGGRAHGPAPRRARAVGRAPCAGGAPAALVAAKEHRSAIGLALPHGALPEPWFEAVTRAADEVAAGLPIFLSADVVVEGEGAAEVERASHEAWRLVDAGMTHLAVDAGAVAPAERGRVLAEVAAGPVERGLGLECVLPLEEGPDGAARAGALVEELTRRGAPPDVVSVRCPEPSSAGEARLQAAALARVCAAAAGVPVMRRGPVTPALLELLRGSPVKACDDGGRAAANALSLIPWALISSGAGPAGAGPEDHETTTRASRLERAAAELSDGAAERLEARAYVEVSGFLEALGAPGSAVRMARALERQLEAR